MMAMFENYTFTLETLSPLRIGSGEKLDSKQYYLDDDHILRLDQRKWTQLLHTKGLIDEFTDAILQGTTVYKFAQKKMNEDCITLQELKEAALYWASVHRLPYDLQDTGRMPYLHLFQSDSEGNPYIPGSSLKGAIVASLLAVYYEDIFTEKQRKGDKQRKEDEQQKGFEDAVHSMKESIQRKHAWKAVEAEAKEALKPMFPDLAAKYIDPKNKRVIYLLQSIRVSDSDPIDRGQLAVCEKADVFPIDRRFADGTWKVSEKNPGIFHESLIPGTKVTFRLSIDEGKLKLFREDMTAEDAIAWITNALNGFREKQDYYYTNMFFPRALELDEVIKNIYPETENHFYFGAGVGWVNKTLTYSIFGEEDDTVDFVADFLNLQFKTKKHTNRLDKAGISPHKLKCVYYKDERYLMGHCAFSIEKTGEI